MIVGETQLEYTVKKIIESYNNIEIYDVSEFETQQAYGFKFDLFDYLNKDVDFEHDIECLLNELDKTLDANILIGHEYLEPTSICDLDGKSYPDYHCWVYVGFMN